MSVRHGCYSPLQLAPRAEELQELIRSQLSDEESDRFDLLVATSAALGAQTERALLVMNDADDPVTSERLARSARGWVKLWMQSLTLLNLTPAAAREASRDAGHRRLAEHLADVYGEAEADDGGADA